MRVAILDIEPIEPAEGGSRQRLKGVYHALGSDIDAVYVGAWHWPGPEFRRFRHSPTLEEITVPFSAAHFAAADELSGTMNGHGVIDASFPRFAYLSEEYCRHARAAAADADILIVSHPWAFAVVRDAPKPSRQMLVYDAHNLEAKLRRHLLGGTPAGAAMADEAELLERDLCAAADLVLTCSRTERDAFADHYGLTAAKLRVVPNGVFASAIQPPDRQARRRARRGLKLGWATTALFIGGDYPPNAEAAEFIRDRVAPACPGVTFAILGAVGERLRDDACPSNVRILGKVDEAVKAAWLAAADIGINPMFSGAGTNIKVLEYMAAGLPVVTTPFGARGIDEAGAACAIAAAGDFAARLAGLARDRAARERLRQHGRALIERDFDWAHISPETGAVLASHAKNKALPAPFFSVIVPTLDRPDKLRRLFDLLAVQRERDFEVIAVDQSGAAFPGSLADFGLDGMIFRTPVRGAGRARNIAAALARGRVLAFTDDDCEPSEEWLSAARGAFDAPTIVGLEGRVYSDRLTDRAWRCVHNYGAEGEGFMTCNLFATADTFQRAGGFDPAFDEHQFREDTDFGWRLQALGDVPFSEAALMYHPPWPRTIPRESDAARARLFESDALMMKKHPARYREMFFREGHFLKGNLFWEPFLRGARAHGAALTDYVEQLRPGRAGRRGGR